MNTVIEAKKNHGKKVYSHEDYIHDIRGLILSRLTNEEREKILATKLVYGAGHGTGARGVTYFSRWKNGHAEAIDIAEVCAFGEENLTQIAGTTLHELAHVLAGMGNGHNGTWKETCAKIGLRKAMAAGQVYNMAYFDPDIRFGILALPIPNDGKPTFSGAVNPLTGIPFTMPKVHGCSIGIGTRGGKSRGVGSGSRLRLYQCECGVKVRVASDSFDATCNKCDTVFQREVK